jgi:hypothetical protein
VTYTVVVSNNGPSAADGARLTDPAVTGLTVTGVSCGSAANGAVCPSSGNTVADLQGAGIVIPTLPSGGSLAFSIAATIISNGGSLTNTATIAPPSGTTDPVSSSNTAHDTDNVAARIYKLYLPLISRALFISPPAQWSVGLGYEDLQLSTGQNDFDYNDWVVDISGTLSYTSGAPYLIHQISMSILPRARGAGYDHSFQIRLPGQLFPSNGTALLTTYDQNHNVLSTQTRAFVGNADNTFVIFPNSSVVFPGSIIDTVEGKTFVPPQRFADLSITFDTPFTFNPNLGDFGMPHGTGLFFDPELVVLNTGDQVHIGDLRLLSVPIMQWLWPEEFVRLDRAYPGVSFTPGSPPQFSFSPSWWTTFNHCVYDGIACGTP